MTYTTELDGRALDDLVDRVMCDEHYPKHGRHAISLFSILSECDQSQLADAVMDQLTDDPIKSLESHVEEIARNYLEGTPWHQQRKDELMAEDEASTKESTLETRERITAW